MKTVKMSLENVMCKMSRKEMRNIMAGLGSGGGACTKYICSELPCCNAFDICDTSLSTPICSHR
jgi:hypothetical protein